MEKIQLVDLKNQYLKIKDEVDKAVIDVLNSTAFIKGPDVHSFQKELEEYLGVKHVIPCANGTDALQIALMSIGLKPGDEVITPSFTYVATCEVVALLHGKPKFVEVDSSTFNMDVSELEQAITEKTKAIIPVHLYGQCSNMEAIMEVANRHNLPVIEDTAQAIGGTFTFKDGSKRKAGTMGLIGCTSFFPSKNLGGYGDGGAIFTNDDETAEKLAMIANHGQSKRYYHDIVGVNSRLDTIQAAILRIKLRHLDSYIAARQDAAAFYTAKFSPYEELTTPHIAEFSDHVFHQYTLKLNGVNREALQKHLADQGIPSNIYYPLNNHMQKAFSDVGYVKGDLPITEALGEEVLSLPMHTELTQEQLEHITSEVITFIENSRN